LHHLVASIDHPAPEIVVDLGCGIGTLTATLLDRWPGATVVGIDSSAEMIEHAQGLAVPGKLRFEVADISAWRAREPVDLAIANASLHWIDDHRTLFDHLLPQMAADGVFAFQVPANHTEPSHTLLREHSSNQRWRDRLDGLPRTGVREPQWYLTELGVRGLDVTVWQTTFFHLLEGEDPVLEWVLGTTLRPILDRLQEHEQEEFLAEYRGLLAEAYPERDGTTVFPFRRTFVVARHSP
jgi:trans-aconitate 2-methyltransferase